MMRENMIHDITTLISPIKIRIQSKNKIKNENKKEEILMTRMIVYQCTKNV